MFAHIKTANTVEVIVNGKTYSIHKDNKNYQTVLDSIKTRDEAVILKAVDVALKIQSVISGLVIEGEAVFWDGEEVHGTMVNRLLEAIDSDGETVSLRAFITKIMKSGRPVLKELYDFLELGKMPINEAGNFYAYKVVRGNYLDKHSGTMDNSIGAQPRVEEVDPDRYRTCSYGLHFCSFEYMKQFYNRGDRVIIVEVDPMDVVAIPSDYNSTKARCTTYKVVADVTDTVDPYASPIPPTFEESDSVVEEFAPDDVKQTTAKIGEQIACTNCGSHELTKKGWTKDGRRRFKCKDCDHNLYVTIE